MDFQLPQKNLLFLSLLLQPATHLTERRAAVKGMEGSSFLVPKIRGSVM